MSDNGVVRIRRARREDFAAVQQLLGVQPDAVPGGSLYRLFRRTIADLTQEFYVAERAGDVLAAMGMGYRRVMCERGQRAAIEELLWRPPVDADVAARLLELATLRARQRGCRTLQVAACDSIRGWDDVLRIQGFAPAGQTWAKEVAGPVPQ